MLWHAVSCCGMLCHDVACCVCCGMLCHAVARCAILCQPRESHRYLNAWQVPGDADGGQLTLECYFDQTSSTDVQVTPAAAAQQDLVPNTEEDVVDEFAAGDAAPQVEAQHQRNGVGADGSVVDDGLIDEFAAGDAAVQIEVSCMLPCLTYML